jgi:outer membrane protein
MRGSAIAASLTLSLFVLSAAPGFAQVPAQAKPAQPAPAPTQAPATPAPATAAPAAAAQAVQAPFPPGARVAFINPPRIFQESADGKVAVARINALTQKKQTENQMKTKQLADNQQKLQTSGSLMSDVARGQLEKEIEKEQLEVQRFQQDAQAEINELQTELQNDFVKKVSPIFQQIAIEKGLHMLFNAADAGFAWVDPGLDLTAEVIKRLDAANKPAAPPKQ